MLTETSIRAAKPRLKLYKLSDSGGLQLHVQPNGSRLWRLAYRFAGKQKTLSIGPHPVVTLAEARAERERAKKLLHEGRDPGHLKQLARLTRETTQAATFRIVAEEFFAKVQAEGRSAATMKAMRWHLNGLSYPYVGDRPISEITAAELLVVLRKEEVRGHLETAAKLRSLYSRIFRYAIATTRATRDVAHDLRGALRAPQVRHLPSIKDEDGIGGLLRAIDEYDGYYATKFALRVAPYLFVRPGELRGAEWKEFDFRNAVWTIPGSRMKMKREHLVPLAPQCIRILKELQAINGTGPMLFPAIHTSAKSISENTLNVALRRMGYTRDEMTSHGFRSMASTRLNEAGFNSDWIERQLAHIEMNTVRRAYNAAEYMPDRVRMMGWWADKLDELRAKCGKSLKG